MLNSAWYVFMSSLVRRKTSDPRVDCIYPGFINPVMAILGVLLQRMDGTWLAHLAMTVGRTILGAGQLNILSVRDFRRNNEKVVSWLSRGRVVDIRAWMSLRLAAFAGVECFVQRSPWQCHCTNKLGLLALNIITTWSSVSVEHSGSSIGKVMIEVRLIP